MQPVFRFAPSPNGFLHLGHAFSALLNADLARRFAGKLLLRIEDIDPARSRPHYERAIIEDLAWLGLTFAEPARRQSAHLRDYGTTAERLADTGLLYPCFCSRGRIATRAAVAGGTPARDPDGAPIYAGTCRALSRREREARLAREPHVWRLAMDQATGLTGALAWTAFAPNGGAREIAARPDAWGDVILVRKDTPTSYHLAVVHDDAAQGVTHVVRGTDLEEATAVHRVAQSLLGYPAPHYHHHALIRDAAGRKLAKSAGSPALRDMRRDGASPDDIRRLVGLAPAQDHA